jgi:SP family general alpha glucoside:H+ symporter-like MFS transporter
MTNFNVDEAICLMKMTNEAEANISAGKSYFDCFKGVNLRRTEIACIAYAAYFYNQAGFDTEKSFDLSLAIMG